MADPKKIKESPWLNGILDALVGVRLISESDIPHKNRLAVIILDSAFETACRAYLKYIAGIKLEEAHKRRENLVKIVKSKLTSIEEEVWKSIGFYYEEIRNDLYHQTSAMTVTDESFDDYKETVEFVIDNAFGIKCAETANAMFRSLQLKKETTNSSVASASLLMKLSEKVDKLILAVALLVPPSVAEVNEFLKKQGDSTRITPNEFTAILGRNTGSKKFFYFDKKNKRWQLSAFGQYRLKQLQEANNE